MQGQSELFENRQITITYDEDRTPSTKIMVIGIGGAGGNSINRMVEAGIKGVELVAANTDCEALRNSLAPIKLEIGTKLTKGSGCGGNPRLGVQAALEQTAQILELLEDSDMVFLIGGEGGGTFTGAAPVFASLASEVGALTIAMVTMPFSFQGTKRRTYAESGLRELTAASDAMIVVPNENLFRVLGEDVSLEDSFRFADDALCQAVQGISDMIAKPGIINLELDDIRAVMQHRGLILMGTGIAEGSGRAAEAAQRAISSPLFEKTPIAEAKAVLINISGSRCSLKLHEAKLAADVIKEASSLEDMIMGAMYDDSMGECLKVTVIAAGFSREASRELENSGERMDVASEFLALKPGMHTAGTCISHHGPNWEELDRPAFQRRRAM